MEDLHPFFTGRSRISRPPQSSPSWQTFHLPARLTSKCNACFFLKSLSWIDTKVDTKKLLFIFYDRWHREGGIPIVNFDGGRYPQTMLPVTSNQTEMMLINGYQTLTLASPSPGTWHSLITADHACDDQQLVLAARAQYTLHSEPVNTVASFHNYQDLRYIHVSEVTFQNCLSSGL